jgi:hypothetical protein
MSGDDADRKPPPSEEERGVRVSRDAPGAEATSGRKKAKLGFRVQAQRREKGDDPVFDNIESRRSPPEPAVASEEARSGDRVDDEALTEQDVGAEAPTEKDDAPGGTLGRVKRFFFRGGD